jgi:hypothetical protein
LVVVPSLSPAREPVASRTLVIVVAPVAMVVTDSVVPRYR